MWVLYFLRLFAPYRIDLVSIHPREIEGLLGVLTASFFHYDFNHLIANSVPLFVFMLILMLFFERSFFKVIFFVMFFGNFFTWVLGKNNYHLGASGLIYGLFAFNLVYGLYLRRVESIVVNLIVITLYTTSIVTGLLPKEAYVSYSSHWFGFLVGLYVAVLEIRRERGLSMRSRRTYFSRY